MVSVGPVYVTVREFLGGRGAHLAHLDVKVQVLAGQGMIAIERHQVTGQLRNRDRARAVLGLRLQAQAHAHIRLHP